LGGGILTAQDAQAEVTYITGTGETPQSQTLGRDLIGHIEGGLHWRGVTAKWAGLSWESRMGIRLEEKKTTDPHRENSNGYLMMEKNKRGGANSSAKNDPGLDGSQRQMSAPGNGVFTSSKWLDGWT